MLLEFQETKGVRKMGLDKVGKSAVDIPAGIHKGEIMEVKERPQSEEAKFDYIDFFITVDNVKTDEGEPFLLKYGVPDKEEVTVKSNLGKLLVALGFDLPNAIKEKLKFNIEKLTVGKKISYQTVIAENGFTELIPQSIKIIK